MHGFVHRQAQHLQLSPQRQSLLKGQLMRRYLSYAVECRIQLVECRMDLLLSNGNHAATVSPGTDNLRPGQIPPRDTSWPAMTLR
jgi:hypothetical protein